MNHDDDDDLDDTEDQLHEAYGDDGILADGETLKVTYNMLDATQRAVADGWDNHRPGWRVPPRVGDQDRLVADSYAGYVRHLQDGYRSTGNNLPVAQPRSGVTNVPPAQPRSTATNVAPAKPPRRPASLQDAQAAADSAREERDAWLRGAYKERPKLPPGWAFGDRQP